MNSGASFQATLNMDMMKNLKIVDLGKVWLANDEILYIMRITNVDLKTVLEITWTMKDVRLLQV